MSILGTFVKQAGNRVELLGSTVHVADLDVPLETAAEYLREIPTEKRELAFVHAVQVGMAEIMARRKRLRLSPFRLDVPPRKDGVEPSRPDRPELAGPGKTSACENTRLRSGESSSGPVVETGAARSSEKQPELARTPQESNGWLRRLDEEFEIIDQRQAIEARKLAAGVEAQLRWE